jgi:hypothetical protein
MTTQRQSQQIDLRSEHDKMRRMFERFSKASSEEKKELAREMMDQLLVRPRV